MVSRIVGEPLPTAKPEMVIALSMAGFMATVAIMDSLYRSNTIPADGRMGKSLSSVMLTKPVFEL